MQFSWRSQGTIRFAGVISNASVKVGDPSDHLRQFHDRDIDSGADVDMAEHWLCVGAVGLAVEIAHEKARLSPITR